MRRLKKNLKRRFERGGSVQHRGEKRSGGGRYKMIITPNHKKFRESFLKEKRRAASVVKGRSLLDDIIADPGNTRDFSSIGMSILTSPSPKKIRHSLKMSKKYKNRVRSRDFTSYKNVKKIGFDLLSSISKPAMDKSAVLSSDESIKNLITSLLKSNKYIKKKFNKYLSFLLKLTETDSTSLQSFLFHISKNSLPKHSGLSAKSLRANWPLLQHEFNSICKEIYKTLFEMKIKEIQVMNLKKNFDYQMKIRKFVQKMLKRELDKEKPPVDFIGTKMEVLDVLNRLNERGRRWKVFDQNHDFMSNKEEWMMDKYKKDWRYWEQMEMRDYRRKKNRINLYRRNKVDNIFSENSTGMS